MTFHVRDIRQTLLSLTSSLKTCSNEASMLVQHHPTLLDATCPHLNTMLDDVGPDVGLSLNLLKIFVQHRWLNNVARCWLRLNLVI